MPNSVNIEFGVSACQNQTNIAFDTAMVLSSFGLKIVVIMYQGDTVFEQKNLHIIENLLKKIDTLAEFGESDIFLIGDSQQLNEWTQSLKRKNVEKLTYEQWKSHPYFSNRSLSF